MGKAKTTKRYVNLTLLTIRDFNEITIFLKKRVGVLDQDSKCRTSSRPLIFADYGMLGTLLRSLHGCIKRPTVCRSKKDWIGQRVRDLKSCLSKKRDFFGVLFRATLFLGKWCGVATYFLYKKEKEKLNIKK